MYFCARLFAGNPIGYARSLLRAADAAIERRRYFHGYEWQAAGDSPGKTIVQVSGGLLQNAGLHRHTGGAQPGYTGTAHLWVGIDGRHDHAGHARS